MSPIECLAVHEALQISQESALYHHRQHILGLEIMSFHNRNLFRGDRNSDTAGFVFNIKLTCILIIATL